MCKSVRWRPGLLSCLARPAGLLPVSLYFYHIFSSMRANKREVHIFISKIFCVLIIECWDRLYMTASRHSSKYLLVCRMMCAAQRGSDCFLVRFSLPSIQSEVQIKWRWITTLNSIHTANPQGLNWKAALFTSSWTQMNTELIHGWGFCCAVSC